MDSGLITALATIGLLVCAILGGFFAWIQHNENRIATLEKGYADLVQDQKRVERRAEAAHERLDGVIHRRGPRADR